MKPEFRDTGPVCSGSDCDEFESCVWVTAVGIPCLPAIQKQRDILFDKVLYTAREQGECPSAKDCDHICTEVEERECWKQWLNAAVSEDTL